MTKIARIGIDTSKSLFQLHGVDEAEKVVLTRRLRRREFLAFMARLEPTAIGLEACGASHHWGRELEAMGHRVALIPPQHSKPYVGNNKNDAADAAAICEAMSRPRLQPLFVPVKSPEQLASQMILGLRESLIQRRTQLSNRLRGYAAEFGVVVPKGLRHIEPLLAEIADNPAIPALAKRMFESLAREFAELAPKLKEVEAELMAWHRTNETSRRLAEIPGVGPIGACQMAIKIAHASAFRSGRHCAAWIGLTPKDHSTAGKQRMGGITRAGDEALRAVLVAGATAYIQQVRRRPGKHAAPWLEQLLQRKAPKLAAVAMANKTARIAWKLMTSGQRYQPNHVPTA